MSSNFYFVPRDLDVPTDAIYGNSQIRIFFGLLDNYNSSHATMRARKEGRLS